VSLFAPPRTTLWICATVGNPPARAKDTVDGVTCYLLHIMEDPDRDAYRDPDLKDVVGLMPRFFCAQCQPLSPLVASDAVRCMRRSAPCWKPTDHASADEPPAT
jgi:hypothetical protein